MSTPTSGQDATTDDGHEHLAPLQDLRLAARLSDVEAPRSPARRGVAIKILEEQRDLEAARAMLGQGRLEATQPYSQIRRAQLKRTIEFYEAMALDALSR